MAVPAARREAPDASAGNTFKGIYAAFGAAAIGMIRNHISVYHRSAAVLVACGLSVYAGSTLVPILHSGYEKVKRDFMDLTGTQLSITDMAICSSVGAIATLATWTINPTAALVVGFGTLFSSAYQFASPAAHSASRSANEAPLLSAASLPRDFLTQQRSPFLVEIGGRSEVFSSLSEAFDALKLADPATPPDDLMLKLLTSFLVNALTFSDRDGLNMLDQLFQPIDRSYKHPGVNLTAVLLRARQQMRQIMALMQKQAAEQSASLRARDGLEELLRRREGQRGGAEASSGDALPPRGDRRYPFSQ